MKSSGMSGTFESHASLGPEAFILLYLGHSSFGVHHPYPHFGTRSFDVLAFERRGEPEACSLLSVRSLY